jgi:putative FmdB family regulatory protein
MPTYDYECANCGHRFEQFQRITEAPLSRCPKCKHKVKRLIGTGAGLLFKGSGFYATDYRSKSYKDAASKDSSASSAAATSESKPASGSSTTAKSAAKKPSE